jgi:protein-S-isoprenylcysteine O-methyltransferase Ste14
MILLDVDPNIVRPGWTPLFVVLLLAVAMVFLYFSMRKQFRKISVPKEDGSDTAEDSASEQPPRTQS